LRDIINEILKTEGHLTRKTIVDTTTVHPDTTKEVAALVSERGVTFIAAPVFGPPPSAVSGQLLMAVAGPSGEALELLAQAFQGVIAQDVIIVSDLPEKAVLLKTLG
jgi:3-hydroxyisobutyrate dehydrogenase-like beta-hydroxyacid dehydrogenase